MSNLRIYDVSPVVYTGSMIDSVGRNRNGFYYAGINYLMKFIALDFIQDNDIILCFDSKSFRKEIDDNYKSGRNIKFRVLAQIEFLYELLSECGVCCVKELGYEADDLVASISEEFRYKYDKVNIITSDYDLAINVRSNVSLTACNSLANDVNKSNFKHAVFPGANIMFNTLAPYKVFCGDKSDAIPCIQTVGGLNARHHYDGYVAFLKENFLEIYPELYGSKDILDYYVDTLKDLNLPQEIYDRIEKNIKLVYPLPYDCSEVKPRGWGEIDREKFIKILNLFYNKEGLRSVSCSLEEVTDMDEILARYSKRLHTGELASDYGLKYREVSKNMQMFSLKDF